MTESTTAALNRACLDDTTIVTAARELLDDQGAEKFSMARLADRSSATLARLRKVY